MNQQLALTCNFISNISKYSHNFIKTVGCRSLSIKFIKNERKEIKIDNNYRSCIANNDSADFLFRNLKSDIKSSDLIVEIDPGSGILTKKLLNNFDNKLILFEPNTNLLKELKNICPNNFSNLIVSDVKFHYFYKYYWESYKFSCNEKHKKYVDVLQAHCSETTDLKIVGTVCYKKFFYSLLFDYVFRGTFFHGYLNPTFYLYVPFNLYISILRLINYQSCIRLGTVCSMYFDIKLLGTTSASDFKHSVRLKNPVCKKLYKNDITKFYLLKFSPKNLNTINERTGNQLISFHYFISHLLRLKKNANIISGIETFIPNCGEEFIKHGFRVFNQPGDLTKDQWFQAFGIFTSHPDFESSIYLNEMMRVNDIFVDEEEEEKTEYIVDTENEMHSICEDMLPELYGNYMIDSEMDLLH